MKIQFLMVLLLGLVFSFATNAAAVVNTVQDESLSMDVGAPALSADVVVAQYALTDVDIGLSNQNESFLIIAIDQFEKLMSDDFNTVDPRMIFDPGNCHVS